MGRCRCQGLPVELLADRGPCNAWYILLCEGKLSDGLREKLVDTTPMRRGVQHRRWLAHAARALQLDVHGPLAPSERDRVVGFVLNSEWEPGAAS